MANKTVYPFGTGGQLPSSIGIINDLTTGGADKALSAEQGKVLKQIVDRLSEINIDGITGFVPISSLNDLPASPTSEQKGMAYILDNALYIYVGNSGDTLDGKYQSTPLVTLDWNDKHYAPLSYNGLGRITLKKNMISNKNVLTAAMVSIANTEYFIQYDYDLKGEIVTLPANASLIFMGGSITNGTLIGNNTRIVAKRGVQIFDNITIQGTWDIDNAYSSWFKCSKDGYEIDYVNEVTTNVIKDATTKKQSTTITNRILGQKKWDTPRIGTSGDGTKSNPYTIAQGISSGSGEFYIKFYPLGICNGDVLNSTTFVACTDGMLDMVDTHIVIVDNYNGTRYVLNLTNKYTKQGINLKDNYAYSAQPMVAKVTLTSDTFGVKAFNCSELGYYEKYLNNVKVVGEEVSDQSISTDSNSTTSESRYKIVGDDASYVAQTSPNATYTSDTLPLQQLLNLGATHTLIEDGIYMIDTSGSRNIGLLVTEAVNKSLTIDGTLKAIPTATNRGYRVLALEGCVNYCINGSGKIQGEMPEHQGNIENGMCLAVSSCYSLVVENIALEYPMCDCAYMHWRTSGTTFNSNNQSNHVWRNVTFVCGRRTGLVYERGDNVTVDKCHFVYNGRYRGIATFAAVDIEPFGSWDSTKRYVENYIFSGNEFVGNRQGLRLERCANTIISGNKFADNLESAIIIMENYLTNKSISSNTWMASYQLNTCEICNNYIYGGVNGISLESTKPATAYIHDNIAISISTAFVRYINAKESKISNNKIYDSSPLCFGTSGQSNYLTNVHFTNNDIIGTRGRRSEGDVLGNLRKTVFNSFLMERNNVLPLPSNTYNGMRDYGFGNNAETVSDYILKIDTIPDSSLAIFKDNRIDDEYLWYNVYSPYYNVSAGILKGLRTVNENNGFLMAGDVVESKYNQKGYVTKSGTIKGKYGIEFEPGMMLYPNQVITDGNTYDIVLTGGKGGNDWASRYSNGAAAFKNQPFVAPEIKWVSVGECTSLTRPTELNTKGRRLVETDTNLLIEYNGTRFVVVSNGYRGQTSERPVLTQYDSGVEYYDTTLNIALRWDGYAWVSMSSVVSGDITEIPDGTTGDMFYLLPDGKPIWNLNGVWKYADGTIVQTNIQFADTEILKQLCVSLADNNGDGEVSYAEAKAVTDIGTHFKGVQFSSFDEFQYFTGVTELKANAFNGCNSMSSLTIPKSVTKINGSAIYTSGAVFTVTILATTPPSGGYPFNGGNKPTSIYVPDESVDAYKAHSVWSAYKTIIKPISSKV